ncbi:C4-type zinc ribbon domain-containing protein [Corynebacterium breve]|uniref:C4-type zinc ribbon domain-containing protein n=1 Tax=Corynebacterium breve TaxID=3049799 RepID=A0ABY8VBI6_9CORY|nr:C4-type zinc ribbon domain-containing protein [Corynebacterium breve]WIM67035.1 C4-type zinc ribbon domain-containing protein [Corynebacterium breve]
MKLAPELHSLLLELATAERAVNQPDRVSPEQQELDKLIADRARMADAASSAQLALGDMELEILRIQEDERKLKKRELDDKRQLSAETDPERRKDLEHDRYAAKSRIADLLSELKEAHNEISALRNNVDVHGARLDELDRKIELAKRAAESAPTPEAPKDPAELRVQLPADVLSLFDDVSAATYNGRMCGGCFLQLPPSERAEVEAVPADELATCPNCGTILIR